MARIDYYFTPLSPFTYLAGERLEEIATRHGVDIDYKPFNLMEVGKHTGFVPLPDRPEARKTYRLQELKRISEYVGLPINLQPKHWPTNPVPACTTIISAQMVGGAVGKLAHRIMRAVWLDDEDMAEDHVLRKCLEDCGFDAGLTDRDMLSAVEIFEKNTNDALNAQIFGSPSYVVDHHVFWGQDRLEYVDRHLAKH
ncbi:MAG: 2-hydroxychromene-2-carboxylate isomerase [Pseudomonadota bacterium]